MSVLHALHAMRNYSSESVQKSQSTRESYNTLKYYNLS